METPSAASADVVMTNNAAAAASCPFHETGFVATLAATTGPTVAATVNLDEVRDFYAQYREFTDMPEDACRARLAEVSAEIAATGTYVHTPDELAVGAKLAWYNHTRCIGKLYWRSLTVVDARHLDTVEGIRDACFEHQRIVHNGGRVKPTITIFAPDAPGAPAHRIRNGQLVAYAGYTTDEGLIGDGGAVELTELALSLGWEPRRRTPFDVIPLMIESPDGKLTAHEVPSELAYEVEIEHPTLPGLSALGLRWYGFPSIANMGMSIGGITYPTSPFTGWYIAPELSARDFTDVYRYDMLEEIARAFGIEPGSGRTLWKDRTMIELTAAVLHSFDTTGIRMDDHHTASEKFHKWTQAERRRGREVDADWTWMIPPISASATPVFHESYRAETRLPNFLRVGTVPVCPVEHQTSPKSVGLTFQK
jgi:nitric-oxide synthase